MSSLMCSIDLILVALEENIQIRRQYLKFANTVALHRISLFSPKV